MDTTIAPGAAFAVHDDAFLDVLGLAPRLARVIATDAHEGPVYVADEHALYFTTVPRPGAGGPVVDIRRLDLVTRRLTTVRADANAANGMTLAPDGRLLVCEQGSMTRLAGLTLVDRETGATEMLGAAYAGRPLNSPNDVVVARDGAAWFTDPSYGFLQGFRSPPALADAVYRLDPASGELALVADGIDKPNGLAFSPDERTLYVGDSGAIHAPGDYDPDRPRRVLAFDVLDHGGLADARVFADRIPGFPDGIKVDAAGRVYVSCERGVQIFGTDGRLLGEIALPGGAVNFTFGGPGRDVLLTTADDAIWAARLQSTGPQP
jgi:gluconolactonase